MSPNVTDLNRLNKNRAHERFRALVGSILEFLFHALKVCPHKYKYEP